MVASVATGWPSALASAATPTLTRYPYVSEVVGNTATVDWATDRSQSIGTATWGADTNGACTPTSPVTAQSAAITVGTTNEYQWTAVLTFPGPGTYCYRVQLAGVDLLGTDPSPQLKTAAAPGSSYSFAVVGDYGAGTTFEANVMSQMAASPASFVVTVGDNVYNSGTETEYGDLSQGNLFPRQYLPALGSRPIFAAEGNHGFTENLPYLQNFPALTAAQTSGGRFTQESYCCISPLSGPQNYPSAWYAFNWGSARYYVLDASWADSMGAYQGDFLAHWNGQVSGCGPCGAELQWLKSDLAANAATPIKFAFFHYPLHADSGGESTDTYLDGPGALEGLLASNNVDIVFNGHAHQYERNYPQIPGKPLVSYVTGSGGAPLGSLSGCSAFDAYAIGSGSSCRAPQPASDANVYGFLLVTVNGNHVTVTPTDSTGRTFDVHTYTIGSSSAPTPTTPGNVTATAMSPSSVQVNWTASTEVVGTVRSYNVYRDGAPIGSVNAPATSLTDTNAQPGTTYTYSVVAVDNTGHLSGPGASNSVTTPGSLPFAGGGAVGCMAHLPAGSVVGATALNDGSGYYEVDSTGDVAAFGGAVCYGSMTGTRLNLPIVGMAVDPASGGYWLVATDGGIFSFNAPFFGSTGNIALNKPIVGMAPTPSGSGYSMVASDGGVFTFGNNQFYGSTGNTVLNQPIVGMAVDRATGGYWLVATDGGIFSFNAPFYGSTGAKRLNLPVVGMAAAADGSGYRLVASDGGVFCFNEPFFGSTGNTRLNLPMVAGLNDNATGGYWLTASDGGVFAFNAPFLGSAA
jgi:Calcineurin-like phosphoesterase/Fibronectin type III domain